MIGLWSVGFYTFDLVRFVQRKPVTKRVYTEQLQAAKAAGNRTREEQLSALLKRQTDPSMKLPPDSESVQAELSTVVGGRLAQWSAYASMAMNLGAALGMFGFGATLAADRPQADLRHRVRGRLPQHVRRLLAAAGLLADLGDGARDGLLPALAVCRLRDLFSRIVSDSTAFDRNQLLLQRGPFRCGDRSLRTRIVAAAMFSASIQNQSTCGMRASRCVRFF